MDATTPDPRPPLDHATIEAENYVELYVQGRLSTAEQIRFEEHFAECEVCIEQLETAEDLGTALRATVAQDTQRAVTVGLAAVVARWLQGPRLAALASGLLLVVALPMAWLVSENRQLSDTLERLQRPRFDIPSLLLTTDRGRGGEPASTLAAPPEEPWLALEIEVDDGLTLAYAATLWQSDDTLRWQVERLEPNPWGVLSLTFARRDLPPGDYRLELEVYDPTGRREPFGVYPFRIVSPSGSSALEP